jgi:hypothetical protein
MGTDLYPTYSVWVPREDDRELLSKKFGIEKENAPTETMMAVAEECVRLRSKAPRTVSIIQFFRAE